MSKIPPDVVEALFRLLTSEGPVEALVVPDEVWDAVIVEMNRTLAVKCSEALGPRIRFERQEHDGDMLNAVHMDGSAVPFLCGDEHLNAFLIGMTSALRLMRVHGEES